MIWQKFKCSIGFHAKLNILYNKPVYIGPLWGWKQLKRCKLCGTKWV